MPDHTSKDFDQALSRARDLVGRMAVRVERQLADAIESLRTGSPTQARPSRRSIRMRPRRRCGATSK